MTLLLLLLACPVSTTPPEEEDSFPGDEDRDGWTEEEGDCDDADRSVNPGAPEVWYDGFDQNCDGNDDDQDGDGTKVDRDCDDTDATVLPRAPELCDGLDNDCNGEVDDEPTDGVSGFADRDGDGFASDTTEASTFCPDAKGYTTVQGDCEDTDADTFPGAYETCDGEDDNCDGEIDENAVDTEVFYPDADGDGYGDDTAWTRACEAPEGLVELAGDCNDQDPGTNPSMAETCDSVDNDCNGTVDDDALDATTVYDDLDDDGYGAAGTGHTACPDSGSANELDCDDANGSVFPDAPEACDLVDNDCDGTADEDLSYVDWYTDADGDGYGDPAAFLLNDCVAPASGVSNDGDCDDTSADRSPGQVEMCDGIDNDCDSQVDVGARDAATFYRDDDADGYGAEDDSQELCEGTGAYTTILAGDCDDSDPALSPVAAETDNDEDDDCDDRVDEDFVVAGDVVIVEIARHTWMGGTSIDADGQWFEVMNNTGAAIDLSGWTITRTSTIGTDSFAVDPASSLVIPAGDVAVFCATDLFTIDNDPDSSLECNYFWGDASLADTYVDAYVDNTFHLQRDDDTLSLGVESTLVDSVTWDTTWNTDASQSTVLLAGSRDAVSNDVYAAWELDATNVWWDDGSSSPEYGTPGSL